MNRATTRWVDSFFSRAWLLRDELPGASPQRFAEAQAELKQLLTRVAEAEQIDAPAEFLGLSYPLVCWLDEQMAADRQLGAAWSEAPLEDQLFGTVDRDWKFWEQAELAGTLENKDPLDLYFLCVAHGFTGRLRNRPEAIQAWMRRAQAEIVGAADLYLPLPTPMAPPPDVAPLHGRRMVRSMVGVGCVASLVLLPTLSYLGMRVWLR